VPLGLPCRDAAHTANVRDLYESPEEVGAPGVLGVESADAHHPRGIGPGGISEKAIVETIRQAGVYGDYSLDAGCVHLAAKMRYCTCARWAAAGALQDRVERLIIAEYVSVRVGHLHGAFLPPTDDGGYRGLHVTPLTQRPIVDVQPASATGRGEFISTARQWRLEV